MIVSISSSIPTFKSLVFRPGLNVLLADVTSESTDRQTRNSAGKTSLIEIVHFLLGGEADKNSLFKKPELVRHTFTGVFRIKGVPITVTRGGADERKVLLSPEDARALAIGLRRDEANGIAYVTVEEWRDFLGHVWFGLPLERKGTAFEGGFTPTFRSLVSYLVRRRKSGGYVTIEKQNEYQQPWDWQVNLSYLLGLGWDVPQAIQDLRSRKKTLASLRQAIKGGEFGAMFGTSAEIRPELARTEERIARLKVQIDNFRVLESYRELADQVAHLKDRMSEITFELASTKETIAYLSRSVQGEKSPAYTAVEKLYEAAGVELPTLALRRFDEVRQFQQSVIDNRRLHLERQVTEARETQSRLETELAAADEKKSGLLKILDGKGAFEDLVHMREDLAVLTSRAETLRTKLQNANILENNLAQQKRESADLELSLQEDHKRNENAIKDATVKVDHAIGELYDDRTGNLIITSSKNGPQIGIAIQGGGNQGGIDMMKIFCFDMMLFELVSERFGGPGFVIHDSHLFDGVDARQVHAAIMFGMRVAERQRGQYIVTMNSDDFGRTGLQNEPEVAEAILPVRLTDDETGGLFGFRFD
ncbi:DUF2326 domain-containing protein [Microvirga sp. BT688]|uniref:ABC-three component system protein n=1 Tax=Microvirga sp. TaxID=1873136 RepID=UPI0016835C0F|nr:DUF2326 domain-containing protein [Microvirga sp.]MBD2746117.1 DUF2326 domain-containing protein [Microvirga sp.]